jgi:hypothetical protein
MLAATSGLGVAKNAVKAPEYYTEPPLYSSRPNPLRECRFGNVGVTGLKVHIYEGVTITVEEMTPGTPAAGKFNKGDVITGINGVTLKGHNPYVLIGTALTEAEAKDGRLVFDVHSAGGKETKQVELTIPVLGAYGQTWPLNDKKSRTVIKQAADYYAQSLKGFEMKAAGNSEEDEDLGIPGALACLFLLSTGDDQYLPKVKAYFSVMGKNIKGIGDHTWNNGYNGIACAEYYLRTGDKSVLPILQYYCDNARERQFYGIGWGHWGRHINPGYVSGGLMNPAGAQVATSLLLAKECGVNVDERTMLSALQYFYRFAGHGSVAYGDHRGEGGLGSNGKDGMVAAMMQVAGGAKGNVESYRQARNSLGLAMLDSYPCLATGHADEGRGDAIWRGIASTYVLDFKPELYHETMNRLTWWYDLSRRPSGALGVATCQGFDNEGTGAAMALAFTAPLKTLRITGAPRSRFANDFTLPENPWGRKTDLAFLSVEDGMPYRKAARNEPIHVLLNKLGTAYSVPEGQADIPREELVRGVHHHNYVLRTQAAKILMHNGGLNELEKLLEDKDPRVRRAALDGMTDYQYWFVKGKQPISTKNVSPAMLESIRKMLTDTHEALYVVDGALLALSCAPANEIGESLPLIMPWTKSDEWWIRESAFIALAAAARESTLAPKVMPTLSEMLQQEDRPQAREVMNGELVRLNKANQDAMKLIVAAFNNAQDKTEILSGPRAGEGGFYVQEATLAGLRTAPERATEIARAFKARFTQLQTGHLVKLSGAFLEASGKMPDPEKQMLTAILYDEYRPELIRRMNEGGGVPLDTILLLTQLKHPEAGWQELGKPASADRTWQFTSFEPGEKNFLHPREGKRFRDVAVPAGLQKWYTPEFDSSKWTNGKAPIGKGVFKTRHAKAAAFENRSTWGEGEFLLARTTFDLDSVDYDYFRLRVLDKQGYHIYLNGHRIKTYIWWSDPEYRLVELDSGAVKRLKTGTNILAVYANASYEDGVQVGQLDVHLEGLKKSDLLGQEAK